jgi:hypothetical protein
MATQNGNYATISVKPLLKYGEREETRIGKEEERTFRRKTDT